MGRRAVRLAAFCAAFVFCAPAAAKTDGPAQLPFAWPAQGTVTGWFGEYRGTHVHPGIDIGTLRSLRVRAATAGRVTAVGTPVGYDGYGNVVIVRTGGLDALYAHLSSARVRRGEWVTAGQPLGVAGCTGWCTGTHLHFELRDRGALMNPLVFLS
jgi:murein DD-endopeptidase MepM/ murein hydrolase activator NlpD